MWLGLWLSHTDYGRRCRKLTTHVMQEGGAEATLFFEPGLGPHLFRYHGVYVLVDRRVDEDKNVWSRKEWYSVWVLGSRGIATKLIDDAKTFGNEVLARRHTAFISNGKGEWDRLGVGAPRELDSVILPGNTAQDVADRIKNFLGRREWYVDRGIPWRIGFGLFGPPRTGKSSLVRAVARELRLPMYVLDLTGDDLNDRNLIVSLAKVPIGAIVLIEDIDAQIGGDSSDVTLSGLLNALDGPLASEGRVLFVTSNAPEKLDAALMGEGRIDVHVQFSYATREQVVGMFLRFFPGREVQATAFADAVPAGVLPPAAIQEHLIARCDDAARAVAEAYLLARKEVKMVRREAAA
jgi:chaperone BCS1